MLPLSIQTKASRFYRISSRPTQRRVNKSSIKRADLTSKPKDLRPLELVPPSSLIGPVRRPFQGVAPDTIIRQPSGSGLPQPSTRVPPNRRARANDLKHDVQKGSVKGSVKAPVKGPGSEDEDEKVLDESVGPSR